jgi:hypothetical protein
MEPVSRRRFIPPDAPSQKLVEQLGHEFDPKLGDGIKFDFREGLPKDLAEVADPYCLPRRSGLLVATEAGDAVSISAATGPDKPKKQKAILEIVSILYPDDRVPRTATVVRDIGASEHWAPIARQYGLGLNPPDKHTVNRALDRKV